MKNTANRFVFPLLACLFSTIGLHANQPNIVLIMSDDMGYSDLGSYGGEIDTPVLDRLARNGLRFTQFYNTSRCCPTRAALLTGLYSHQAGVGLMTSDLGYESYRGQLNRSCVTVAEVLGEVGYANYMVGKWHLTRNGDVRKDGNNSSWPLQRGFDRFYGTIAGAGSFFDPASLCRDNMFITPLNDSEYQPERFYYTDAISDNAVRYISDHFSGRNDDPFFLYVSYTSPHWPLHALEEEMEKYKGRYDQGYREIREARHQKAISEGVVSGEWPLSPEDVSWNEETRKSWNIRCMEVYAAMVDRMDQGIGRIVTELDARGVLEDTLIVYLQDNGGCAEPFGRRSNLSEKAAHSFQPLGPDDLQKQIWPPMQTRDGRWVATGPEVMPGAEDTYLAYGIGWANVSNTPFRGYKHDPTEGGIGTPFILHWPNGTLSSQQGAIVDTVGHLIDVMPTFVEASGAAYPGQYNGSDIQPMEGVSLIPTLSGDQLKPRQNPIGFEHHGNLALRDGRWKILSTYRDEEPISWELYDMEKDRTELENLADVMPDRLSEMIQKWEEWAERVGVQPWPIARDN
ncbi:MAG: arylsulfatase [Verrucomicrobiota bacterium]